jgi:hypothetical protein
MKKILTISVLTTAIFSYGCASHKPQMAVEHAYQSQAHMAEQKNEIKKENYEKSVDGYDKFLEQKMLKRTNIIISTVEIDAEWAGVVQQRVGDVILNFSLKELNGVGASFHTYRLRLLCSHDYFVKNYSEERTGTFFFDNPVTVAPFETAKVKIKARKWVRKNLNRMNRLISSDDISIELEMEGEDQNGHPVTITTKSGII